MNNFFKRTTLFFSILLLLGGCKDRESLSVVKQLNNLMEKEILAVQKGESLPDDHYEALAQTIQRLTPLVQKKQTAKNRLIYFYNEALAQTLMATHLLLTHSSDQLDSKVAREKQQEGVKAMMQGIECYHECFRLLSHNPTLFNEKEQKKLKTNSEFLHLLLLQMDHESQQENSENQNNDQKEGEEKEKNSKQKEEDSSSSNEKNSQPSNAPSQQPEEGGSQENQKSSPHKDQRLSQERLNQMQPSPQQQEDSPTSPLTKEEKKDANEGKKLTPELLQAILEEQQRKESTYQIQTQEGYNHVDKDW